MKELSKEYPLAWSDVIRTYLKLRQDVEINRTIEDVFGTLPFHSQFGYLILDYFPKHGIEIERIWVEDNNACIYNAYDGVDYFEFDTPEDAIRKAFELRENQLRQK